MINDIKPKSTVDIAQGKDMNGLGLICSMSLDYVNSLNGEMQMELPTSR